MYLGEIVSFAWIDTLPDPWLLSEEQFELYLQKIENRYPDFHDRLKAINLWRIGTPYGLYCLGEEKGRDDDPIIRYDSSDCTVHILTTIAFAQSATLEEARNRMIDIHYKADSNGIKTPNYDTRWHFTSDRILNHHMTVDITSTIAKPNKLENIDIILNKKEDGNEFLELGWSLKKTINFLPYNNLDSNILSRLPSICGVAFVKKSYFKLGIVIAHEGYLIDGKNLIHASSEELKTVSIELLDYLNNKSFDGVMFYEIR